MTNNKNSDPITMNKYWTTFLSVTTISLLSLPLAHAGLYRWVDAKGEVSYSDIMPPSSGKSGHTELNKQGMTVKTTPAPPTAEELEAQKKAEAKKKAEEAIIKDQKKRDQYLLANYADLKELDSVFSSKMSLLDKSISDIKERQKTLQERLDNVKKQLTAAKDDPKVHKTMEGYISEAEQTLANYDHALQENQTEKQQLDQQHVTDKQRLGELLSSSPSSPPPDPSKAPEAKHVEPGHQ